MAHHVQPQALTAGLGYITNGWPVFVLGRSKRPVANCAACHTADGSHDRAACDCLTCHGFYAATTDPDRLVAMLTAVPGGLLAIRTGTSSGLLVVDIDPRNGGRLDRVLMTPTAAVATGGGGWHLYYRHPGTPTAATLPGRAGVDIKGDGGYVAAPPSVHPGTRRPYRWTGRRAVAEMPPALAAAVVPPPAAVPPAPSGPLTARGAGAISSPAALLAAHLAAVERAPQGRRRVTLYGAARGVWRMIAAGVITEADGRAALTAAGLAAQQTPRQTREAVDGGFTDEAAAA
jgi:Bifunctional DNA primase/polymerase, N-terminal